MSTPRSIAFCLYFLCFLAPFVFGVRYLVRSRFLPYHQAALNMPWEALDFRLQTLLLGLIKAAAGGMLATAAGGFSILFLPFRAGASWANWALLAILLCGGLPTIYATNRVWRKTGASTPQLPAILVVALGVIACAIARS